MKIDYRPNFFTLADSKEATWNRPFLVSGGVNLNTRLRPADVPEEEPVSTDHGRCVMARDLIQGDILVTRSGRQTTVYEISFRREYTEVLVLEILSHHNHTVGMSEFLVHNGTGAKDSPGPPSFVADHPLSLLHSRENHRDYSIHGTSWQSRGIIMEHGYR